MSETSVKVERNFLASREVVYACWTSPEALKEWHCGTVSEVVMELRVGGEFRISFAPGENGNGACVRGKYLEVNPPQRLQYTWTWDHSKDENSVVTVEFIELGDEETLVRITHEKLATEMSREGHTTGWKDCLDGIGKQLGKMQGMP